MKFPCLRKITRLTPVFKKEDQMGKSSYRPISILSVFLENIRMIPVKLDDSLFR